MAFQAVPETAEVNTIYEQEGITLQMTFYARFEGGYSQTDVQNLANLADFGVGAYFLPIQTDGVSYIRSEARGLAVLNDVAASANANAGPGLNASGSLPNQVTIAIQRNAGLTGRSARGRIFWIGLARDDISADENFVNPLDVTAIVAAVANFRGQLDQSGWDPVIVSRYTGGSQRPEGVTFPWLNTLAVDARVDTLRGRLP